QVGFGTLRIDDAIASGPATAGIRPESLRLVTTKPDAANAFSCSVESVSYLGEAQLVRINVQGTRLTAKVPGAADIARDMWVTVEPSQLLLYPGALDLRPASWSD